MGKNFVTRTEIIYEDGYKKGYETCINYWKIIGAIQILLEDGKSKDDVFFRIANMFHVDQERFEYIFKKSIGPKNGMSTQRFLVEERKPVYRKWNGQIAMTEDVFDEAFEKGYADGEAEGKSNGKIIGAIQILLGEGKTKDEVFALIIKKFHVKKKNFNELFQTASDTYPLSFSFSDDSKGIMRNNFAHQIEGILNEAYKEGLEAGKTEAIIDAIQLLMKANFPFEKISAMICEQFQLEKERFDELFQKSIWNIMEEHMIQSKISRGFHKSYAKEFAKGCIEIFVLSIQSLIKDKKTNDLVSFVFSCRFNLDQEMFDEFFKKRLKAEY